MDKEKLTIRKRYVTVVYGDPSCVHVCGTLEVKGCSWRCLKLIEFEKAIFADNMQLLPNMEAKRLNLLRPLTIEVK